MPWLAPRNAHGGRKHRIADAKWHSKNAER